MIELDPADQPSIYDFPYYWRVHKYLPERFGQPCRVLARGKLNSALVEFPDGYKVITQRWFARKRKFEEACANEKKKNRTHPD